MSVWENHVSLKYSPSLTVLSNVLEKILCDVPLYELETIRSEEASPLGFGINYLFPLLHNPYCNGFY